jgi:seryl-tRNA synthetase
VKIQWDLVGRAITFYEGAGFRYVEVPWIVDERAISATLPPGRKAFEAADGFLVGSAEQSLLKMVFDGSLKEGDYVAASPCFRDDVPDELHQRHFFKVELMSVREDHKSQMSLHVMTGMALSFFRQTLGVKGAAAVKTNEGFDIQIKGIEVGSYGQRSANGYAWVYGTGLALPRFSIACNRR